MTPISIWTSISIEQMLSTSYRQLFYEFRLLANWQDWRDNFLKNLIDALITFCLNRIFFVAR